MTLNEIIFNKKCKRLTEEDRLLLGLPDRELFLDLDLLLEGSAELPTGNAAASFNVILTGLLSGIV